MIEYIQRFYPIPVRGGKWVDLWNMGVEVERMWWRFAIECQKARVDYEWEKIQENQKHEKN